MHSYSITERIRLFQKNMANKLSEMSSEERKSFFKTRPRAEAQDFQMSIVLEPMVIKKLVCDLNTLSFTSLSYFYYLSKKGRLKFKHSRNLNGLNPASLGQFVYNHKTHICEMFVLEKDLQKKQHEFKMQCAKQCISLYRRLGLVDNTNKQRQNRTLEETVLDSLHLKKVSDLEFSPYLYASLHTVCPELGSEQVHGEVSYLDYERTPIKRDKENFHVEASYESDFISKVKLKVPVIFNQINEDSEQVAKYIAIGTGDGKDGCASTIVFVSKLDPAIALIKGLHVVIKPDDMTDEELKAYLAERAGVLPTISDSNSGYSDNIRVSL